VNPKREKYFILSLFVLAGSFFIMNLLFSLAGPEFFKAIGVRVYRKMEKRESQIVKNVPGLKFPHKAYSSNDGDPSPEEIYEKAGYVTKIEVWQDTILPGIKSFAGSGSRSVINCKTYDKCVLTAWHVVDRSTSTNLYLARFKDGSPPEIMELVGWSEKYDFAVLRFSNAKSTPTAKTAAVIGKSSELKPGSKIMAIGSNIFGDYWFSVVGNLYKEAGAPKPNLKLQLQAHGLPNEKVLIFSTPLFAGFSGGPLLNAKGELIGISSAVIIIDGIPTYLGMPIDEIMEEMEDMLKPEK